MRIVPIKEVFNLSDGETVPSVRGKITKIYGSKRGQNDNGDWSFQNFMLRADDGTEIKVKCKDRPDVPKELSGKIVVISCAEGQKGLSGVKAKEDVYEGKTSRILWVTPSASIEVAGSAQQADQPSDNDGGNAEPPPRQPEKPKASGNGDPLLVEKATKRARDYYQVMEAAHVMRVAWDHKHPDHHMSADHFHAACSTLYIQLQRDGVINGSN